MVVLHGGPGAPGHMAPIARKLADQFQVLEPFQRGSGGVPLTVACHVRDLHELVEQHCAGERPALVGASWGAMLALAYAATHPEHTGPLVLIGCGTFDAAARERLQATISTRMSAGLKRQLARLADEVADPDERLEAVGTLLLPLYAYDPLTATLEGERCDARAHHETWADMVRLQEAGVYPAAIAAIGTPVLMLHGAVDPHPGPMIRASLALHLPQLEYREWERCSHYPWLERVVCDEFFAVLRAWLVRHLRGDRPDRTCPT